MFDETNDLSLDFDTAAVAPAPADDYAPIPDGRYTTAIQAVEMKPTRDGTGKRLSIRLRIIGPTHAGRVLFASLNVVNRNPKAQEIARRQLAQLLQAIELVGERDMSQLVDREVDCDIVIRPASGDYAASNDVKRWHPATVDAPVAPVAPVASGKPGGPVKKSPAFMR